MAATSIQWCDHSINPIRARHKKTGAVGHYCEKIATGCTNCYASTLQRRFNMPAFGSGQHRDDVEVFLDEAKLLEVRKRKKPTSYFWCDMTDLFGDWVSAYWITQCLATMWDTPGHTHLLLTKRPDLMSDILNSAVMWRAMRAWLKGNHQQCANGEHISDAVAEFKNVWCGTSIANQADAKKNLPKLAKCRDRVPVLFVSAEPLVGPVDLTPWLADLDWVIVGGESGQKARMNRVVWTRSIIKQCAIAGVPCFHKQMGAFVVDRNDSFTCDPEMDKSCWPDNSDVEYDIHGFRENYQGADCRIRLRDSKGGVMEEWPIDLRVRQFPVCERR